MLHIHKWKKDSTNSRTCIKCRKHQYQINTGWIETSCKVHQQMILYDMSRDMKKLEEHKCEYCNTEEVKI
jgi:hypothetical protein